jgi:hypothetical protein
LSLDPRFPSPRVKYLAEGNCGLGQENTCLSSGSDVAGPREEIKFFSDIDIVG